MEPEQEKKNAESNLRPLNILKEPNFGGGNLSAVLRKLGLPEEVGLPTSVNEKENLMRCDYTVGPKPQTTSREAGLF